MYNTSTLKTEIEIGKIIQTEFNGPIQIIQDLGMNESKSRQVLIKFLDTGTVKEVNYYNALKGVARDPYRKDIFGVACKGEVTCIGANTNAYHTWFRMIERCYDPKAHMYPNYGGIGVKVCDRWLCFEYFLQDIPYLQGYSEWIANPGKYQLDKDVLQQNIPKEMRIYSAQTCMFISQYQNTIMRTIDHKKYGNPHTEYYGIIKSGNNFQAYIVIDGTTKCLGTYYDAESAAVVYDHYARLYGKPLLNNLTYPPLYQALQNRTPKSRGFNEFIDLCRIVK